MRVIKVLLPIMILAAAGGVFAYFKHTRQEPAPLESRDYAPRVSVQAVEKVTATPMVRVFGRVESSRVSTLTAGVESGTPLFPATRIFDTASGL